MAYGFPSLSDVPAVKATPGSATVSGGPGSSAHLRDIKLHAFILRNFFEFSLWVGGVSPLPHSLSAVPVVDAAPGPTAARAGMRFVSGHLRKLALAMLARVAISVFLLRHHITLRAVFLGFCVSWTATSLGSIVVLWLSARPLPPARCCEHCYLCHICVLVLFPCRPYPCRSSTSGAPHP